MGSQISAGRRSVGSVSGEETAMVALIWVVLFLLAVIWFLWFRRTPMYGLIGGLVSCQVSPESVA